MAGGGEVVCAVELSLTHISVSWLCSQGPSSGSVCGMPCDHIVLTNGAHGFLCSRGGRRSERKCAHCGASASLQCDYPIESRRSGTCDKHLCMRCAIRLPVDRDFCPTGHKPPLGPVPTCAGCRKLLPQCDGLPTCRGIVPPHEQLELW